MTPPAEMIQRQEKMDAHHALRYGTQCVNPGKPHITQKHQRQVQILGPHLPPAASHVHLAAKFIQFAAHSIFRPQGEK
jgi:hypothetical protein